MQKHLKNLTFIAFLSTNFTKPKYLYSSVTIEK